ncbi:MAG: polysaccharide pyruvyl transferase CsaB [Cyanobacteria bacterium]|nr:polysaccharide pyruvyl transferase CsaB [Cyanobacteriota bacterium]
MRAVLSGYYGMDNGGDEALLATLLQMLPPTVTPVVLSGQPAATQQRYGVEALPRKSLPAVLAALRGGDAFIWGGGSLMQDTTSGMNPLYYGGLMAIAQLRGLKTIAWAQGIGPLQRPWSRWLTRRLLQQCAAVSVRDDASAGLAARWQVPAWLAPDPVWAMDSQPLPGLWDLPAPRIAVALRSHPWLTAPRIAQFTTALADFQRATQTCVLLVPFQPSHDRPLAEHIQRTLPGPSEIMAPSDPRQLKGLFRGVDMAIAMRLHGLIMAAAEGCRCFALSYDPKVTHLMADVAMPGWAMDPADTQPAAPLRPWPDTAAAMTQQWLEHYTNGEPPSRDQIQSRRDRAYLHRDLLHQTLLI